MEKVRLGNFESLKYDTRESFNSIRTNISFCGPDLKAILITSCTQDEGKTTTTMELARSYAEDGKKVLVVDCDLRRSVMVGRYHAVNETKNIMGLSHYLTAQKEIEDVIYESDVENLHILFAGKIVPNPTVLLGNEYFKTLIDRTREIYDVILLDTPPLGSVIDAAVVAPVCDGAILLVESNKNNYKLLQYVKQQLEVTGVKILGVILNKIQRDTTSYNKNYYIKEYM